MTYSKIKFNIASSSILEACLQKLSYHIERYNFWHEVKEDVVKEIQEHGIKFNESKIVDYITKYSSNNILSNKEEGPTIVIDEELKNKLSNVLLKIEEHSSKRLKYKDWANLLLMDNATRDIEIDYDDYVFFFRHTTFERDEKILLNQ